MQKKSFTLVELMLVIAILAILSAIVIFALNPARLFDNFRDSKRVTDISSINKAIVFMESWNQSGINYGTSTVLYVSLPDSSATCSNYTLPTLPVGYTYSCKPTSTFKNTDGTGWIPINFTVEGSNKYLSSLPVDPVNNTTFFYTYFPGGSYEVSALLKNPNANSINDSDSLTGAFTLGSPNRSWTSPLSRDTNLVGHWRFDEASGNALDYSGNGYHGTLNGGVSRVTTTGDNKAVYYDTSGNGYIVTPSFAMSDTGILTLSTWMNSKLNTTKYQSILGDSNENGTIGYIWLVRTFNTNNIFLGYAYGSGRSSINGNNFFQNLDNQWVHIVVICDYINKKGYVFRDGAQFGGTQNLMGTPLFPSTNRAKYIGTYSYNQDRLTDGSLDDVKIYNRGLSTQEISQIYNQTKSKYQ